MRRIKRYCYLTAASIVAAALLAPAAAFAVTLDPYAYRSISGSIYLEYEKGDTQDSLVGRTHTRRFIKAVSLDLTSWIASRRMITYRAGTAFTHSDEQSTTRTDTVKTLSYYLTLNFLPLSPIPLTVYGSRLDTTAKSSGDRHDTEYGLQWFGYFPTFPQTTVGINRRNSTGRDVDEVISDYNVGLLKAIGPSINELTYKGSINDNRLTRKTSDTHLFSFTNRTDLPGNSRLYVGLTKNLATSEAQEHTDMEGVSLSFASRPSPSFNQSHSYTSLKSSSEISTNESTYYSGSIDNYFSSRLRAHLSLSVNDVRNNTLSSASNVSNLTTDNYLSYAVTRDLTLTETVKYTDNHSENTTDVFTFNVADRKRLEINTDVRYNRRLNWAGLTAGYGFGYTDDTAEVTQDRTGGKGISQTARMSLSDINFNRFVGFNTSVEDRRTKKLTGNLTDEYRSFTFGVFNRIGKAYISLDANYSASIEKSYLDAYNGRSEEYDAGMSSGYFSGTNLGLRAARNKTINEVTGVIQTDTKTATAEHTRNLLGGAASFHLKIERSNTQSSQVGTIDQTIKEMEAGYSRVLLGGLAALGWKRNVNDATRMDNVVLSDTETYSFTYERPLLRLVKWFLKAEKKVEVINAAVTDSRAVLNSFYIPVRAWTFSAEHTYKHIVYETNNSDFTETRILFRASRYFFNAF